VAGDILDRLDFLDHFVKRHRHSAMHIMRFRSFDEMRAVAVADQQCFEFGVRDARENGRTGDLVAIQVQDR